MVGGVISIERKKRKKENKRKERLVEQHIPAQSAGSTPKPASFGPFPSAKCVS